MNRKIHEVSIVIPNFNGLAYLKECIPALAAQSVQGFPIYVVDNGSSDESLSWLSENFPQIRQIPLGENFGFCGAVNAGIRASRRPYVILLNNDTQVHPDFVRELLAGIRRHKKAFSCQARMIQYHNREQMDDAGNFYNALGWAFARGKGKPLDAYDVEEPIFSSCAGAAIYRRKILEEIGCFDEEHFAYLEDMDLCYRARIYGYENWYLPYAVVYHIGSGTTGSRYNQFKTRYSSRNNVYMAYKNMPLPQLILNSPLLAAGFFIKFLFFVKKGFGREYAAGIKNGLSLCKKEKKVPFSWKHLGNYCKIQWELWKNIGKFLKN